MLSIRCSLQDNFNLLPQIVCRALKETDSDLFKERRQASRAFKERRRQASRAFKETDSNQVRDDAISRRGWGAWQVAGLERVLEEQKRMLRATYALRAAATSKPPP